MVYKPTFTSLVAKLVYKWLNSMVYGRYNELVNGGYFMVYKPTNITGGAPSCAARGMASIPFTILEALGVVAKPP